METIEMTLTLAPCPECHEVMVLSQGVIKSRVTFWTKDNVLRMITPHVKSCSLDGKALPDG